MKSEESKLKPMVKAIIAGACVIVIGLIIFLIALGVNGWQFKADFDTAEFTAAEENSKIVVENSLGEVQINYYSGDKVQISYPTAKNYKVSITEQDGTVKFKSPKTQWYEFSLFWADIPATVINLPENATFALDLTVNAGSLQIKGDYTQVILTVNAGALKANDVTCENFEATVNAGSVNISALTCQTTLKTEVNAGSLKATNLTCPDITAEVNAGSLTLSIIGVKAEYTIQSKVSAGSSNIHSQTGTSPDKKLNAEVSAGSLHVSFSS